MKWILIPLILFALVGCEESAPMKTVQAGSFVVETLFEVDGCRVYRFKDGGYARYFSNCDRVVSDAEREIQDDAADAVEGV